MFSLFFRIECLNVIDVVYMVACTSVYNGQTLSVLHLQPRVFFLVFVTLYYKCKYDSFFKTTSVVDIQATVS